MEHELSSIEKDVLKEIGNIGAGHAATAMAQLINQKVDMAVPTVNIIAFDDVMEIVGGPDMPVAAIVINIAGDVSGKVYCVLSIAEAEFIASQVTGKSDIQLMNNLSPENIVISALMEVGNILTGSYLAALSDFTQLNMVSSVPDLSIDMAGAILSGGLIDLSQYSDYAIIIDTQIKHNSHLNRIHGHFLLLPDPGSFAKIFKALGVHRNDK